MLTARFGRCADETAAFTFKPAGATLVAAVGTVISALARLGILEETPSEDAALAHLVDALAGALRANPTLLASLPTRIAAALAQVSAAAVFADCEITIADAEFAFIERLAIVSEACWAEDGLLQEKLGRYWKESVAWRSVPESLRGRIFRLRKAP